MTQIVTQGWYSANGLLRHITTRDSNGRRFSPDWVILVEGGHVAYIKLRTMGLLSKKIGSTAAEADCIMELDADGFWIGTSTNVNHNIATGNGGLVQYIAGKCDGVVSHIYSYLGQGSTTGAAKNTTRVAPDASAVENLNGTVATFTPKCVFVVDGSGATHVYMKTADMPTAQSIALGTTVALGSELNAALAANCGIQVGNSTLNVNGTRYHVLALALDSGVFNTLKYTGTGSAGATGVAPTFAPNVILSKGNTAQVGAIYLSAYADDPAQKSKALNDGAWHATGYINSPSMSGWNVGALAHVDAAVDHFAAYWYAAPQSLPLPALRTRGSGRARSRLYPDESWWNTPIDPAAASDALAAGYIKNLKGCVDGMTTGGRGASITGTDIDGSGSGQSFAVGTKAHPLASWTWDPTTAPTYSDKGTFLVRTPRYMVPGAGNDRTISILDETTGLWLNVFEAVKIDDTNWTYTFALQYPDGTLGHQNGPSRHNAVRNHGSELMAGAIRKRDMQEGAIRHRLAFIYGSIAAVNDADGKRVDPAANGYKWGLAADGVSLATATDAQINPGSTQSYLTNANAIPSGSVMRLKASLTDNDLATLSVGNPRQLIIAKALRDYGMVLVDGVAGFYLAAERPAFGNFSWEGYLDWRDARDLTKSAVMNTTYWDVVQMPTAWQPAP